MHSISDLSRARALLPGAASEAFFSLYEVHEARASCVQPPALQAKYGAAESQSVVSVSSVSRRRRTFWNAQRSVKPQSFSATGSGELLDPTVTTGCDFCAWHTLTAQDSWGRVENAHAVSASNLFKATQHHGLLLFKHHHPLQFSEEALGGLLDVAQRWVHQTHAHHPGDALHPMLLWNCGPRAGASQYHGHAQVVMTETPLPEAEQERTDDQQACCDAHEALGLLRRLDSASAYAEIAPTKDCETVVTGPALDASFTRLMHLAMRALIDRCGVKTFNVALHGLSLTPSLPVQCITARIVSRGKLSSQASDFGALEVFGGASIGHTSPWCITAAIDEELRSRGGGADVS